MNKQTPILFVLALSFAAVLAGCGPKESPTGQVSDAVTYSNKLAEATSKLAQREVAFETLRVKSELQSSEVQTLTNRVLSLRTELAETIEANRKLLPRIQSAHDEITKAQALQKGMEGDKLRLEQEVATLRQAADRLAKEMETAQAEIKTAGERLNRLETERARMMQQWNDTAQLRAQLKNLKRPTRTLAGPFFRSEQHEFKVNPDGAISAAKVTTKGS
jgi:chromosome segregation ATPase